MRMSLDIMFLQYVLWRFIPANIKKHGLSQKQIIICGKCYIAENMGKSPIISNYFTCENKLLIVNNQYNIMLTGE